MLLYFYPWPAVTYLNCSNLQQLILANMFCLHVQSPKHEDGWGEPNHRTPWPDHSCHNKICSTTTLTRLESYHRRGFRSIYLYLLIMAEQFGMQHVHSWCLPSRSSSAQCLNRWLPSILTMHTILTESKQNIECRDSAHFSRIYNSLQVLLVVGVESYGSHKVYADMLNLN
jgi:hypothetical protein